MYIGYRNESTPDGRTVAHPRLEAPRGLRPFSILDQEAHKRHIMPSGDTYQIIFIGTEPQHPDL